LAESGMINLQVCVNVANEEGKETLDECDFSQFDYVVFNRNISATLKPEGIIMKAQLSGCKLVCDIDDSWILNKRHALYKFYEEVNFSKCIETNIKLSNVITCTTPLLAKFIKAETGRDAVVLPNALLPHEEQFSLEGNKHNYNSVAFVGGAIGLAPGVFIYWILPEAWEFFGFFLSILLGIVIGGLHTPDTTKSHLPTSPWLTVAIITISLFVIFLVTVTDCVFKSY